VLRRIFRHKWEEVTGCWRKFKVRKIMICPLQNNIRIAKSQRMRLARIARSIEEMRSVYKILLINPKGRDHLEVLGVDGRIILK
jgi:hypothetical protein